MTFRRPTQPRQARPRATVRRRAQAGAAIGLLLTALAGCAAQMDAPDAAAPRPKPQVWPLTERSYGPLTLGEERTVEQIKAQFPGLEIVDEEFMAEGTPERRIRAREPGVGAWFEVIMVDERIEDLTLYSAEPTGPGGIKVGQTYRSAVAGRHEPCFPMAEGQAYLICPIGSGSRLQALFEIADASGRHLGAVPRPDAKIAGLRIW